MNVLVLSDTHLGPGQAPVLIDKLGALLDDADVIIHAGDVTDQSVLDALAQYAPVHAVLGNNDRSMRIAEQITVRLDRCEIAVIHDSGPSSGRGDRLHRWFPTADIVVFGHSHLPWNVKHVRSDDEHVQHHLNPGSAIQRRQAPYRTAAVIELASGRVDEIRHVTLP